MLYSVEKYTGYNPLTMYWLSLALCDAALLHAVLACADSFIVESWNPRERPIAIKPELHIQMLNERSTEEPLVISDGAIDVISTITIMAVIFS